MKKLAFVLPAAGLVSAIKPFSPETPMASNEPVRVELRDEDQVAAFVRDDRVKLGMKMMMHGGAAAALAEAFARHRILSQADGRGEVLSFNVNENVWVKLTNEGRAYHRRWHESRYPMLAYRAPDESADGWSRWQFWVLMRDFGDAIYMGGPNPFETTIRLTEVHQEKSDG